MPKPFRDQLDHLDAALRTAQYLAALTSHQDIWAETGTVLVQFFGAEACAIAEADPAAGIRTHHWTLAEPGLVPTGLEAAAADAATEVVESGFLALRTVAAPEPWTLVGLPIPMEDKVARVMLVGHRGLEPFTRDLLNLYLAVVGLVGTSAARLAAERELHGQRQNLELQVQERTAELTRTNQALILEIEQHRQDQEALRQSNAFLEKLINHANAPVIVWDPRFRITRFNRAFETLTGHVEADVLGQPLEMLFPPELAPASMEVIRKTLTGERGEVVEIEILHKDKSVRTVLWSSATLFEADGTTPVATISQGQDITERKQAEEALRRSEERYHSILLASPDTIAITDLAGRLVMVSPSASRMFRLEPNKERLGHPITDFIVPEDRDRARSNLNLMLQGINKGPTEYRGLRQDGSTFDMEVNRQILRDPEGSPLGLVLVARDTSDRKKAEATLRQEQQFSRSVLDSLPGIFYLYSYPDLRLVLWNQQHESQLGFGPGEMKGRHVTDWHVPGARAAVIEAVEAVMEHGQNAIEASLVAKDGHLVPFLLTGVRFESQGQRYLMGIGFDLTERKQAEEALQAKSALLEAQLNATPDGILVVGEDNKRVLINQRVIELFGVPQAILAQEDNSFLLAHVVGQTREPERFLEKVTYLNEHINETSRDEIEFRNGMLIERHSAPVFGKEGKYYGRIWTLRDITERKQAEEDKARLQAQLLQSQKMESLGTLAGGVAHDMNNVLGAILALASAHIGTQPYGSPLHQALDTICKATERGGKMVKSLLSFARQTPVENNKVDLNAILKEQVSLLERTTLAKVRLEMNLEAQLRPIQGDGSALAHAFMNLCVNAVEAMQDSGTLKLRTRNLDNGWIEVQVEDTGTGMPKGVLEKALDPFFTTKEVGKGTGLGLSMAFSTVKAHRGQMTIQSEPGQGTVVVVRFPASESEALVEALPIDEAAKTPSGALNVLLVDDDELIQSSVQMILKVLGHQTVAIVPSGEEALALLEKGLEPDLVILDMNMPGLGGAGTLPRLRLLRPTLPVLLSTGKTDQTALNLVLVHPGVTLLSKPFGLRELQRQLESIGLG
jgi:PAS domain S-box-containing protein